MDLIITLPIIWAVTMNYSWYHTFRKDGSPWHWKIFLGPAVYENHIRAERNHDLRVIANVITAAGDAWRRDYIWR